MAYLIDGNNLIGHLPGLNLRDLESRYRLVSRLHLFHKIKNTRVIIVFDGPPNLDLPDKLFKDRSFSVRYPGFEENADSVIKDIISRQTDLRQFFVVSSDREIQQFARSKRAKILDCEKFRRELKTAMKVHKEKMEMKKHASLPSPLEVKHWTDIFGQKK